MNDMQNPAQFFADEKAARLREELLEAACEREAAEYFDDCETGDNTEWAQYDQDESCDALQAIWNVLSMKEEPPERVALAREICRGVMRNAANSHCGQVVANRNSLKMSANQIMAKQERFANVYCSQCGQEFGPGEHGFSHCTSHAGIESTEDCPPDGAYEGYLIERNAK